MDIRSSFSAQLQLLGLLCDFSNSAVVNSLNDMSNTQLIAREVISPIILQTQVNDLVDNFRIQISTTFDRTLKLIRETSVGNQLVSGWKTDASANFYAANAAGDLWAGLVMNILPQSADELPCYCSTTFQCQSEAAIYQETDPVNPVTSIENGMIPIGRRRRLRYWFTIVRNKITTFNLFPDRVDDDENRIREQRYASRLYLVLLCVSVLVLIIITSLSPQYNTCTIEFPTITIYKELQSRFPNTLTCPCSQVNIPYGRFIQLYPSFHQVCSSVFITEQWIAMLFPWSYITHYEDFRVQAAGQFQLLQSFCALAEQTVVTALQDFATSEFITANVISAAVFDAQMRSTISIFQLEAPGAFISALELIRRATHGNAFMTVYANEEKHKEWVELYSNKLKGIFVDKEQLLTKLNEDIDFYTKMVPITVEALFMWNQLLSEILNRMPLTSISRKDLRNKCRLEYQGDDIEWYTRDAFLYRLLNRELKTRDISITFRFRFVLVDLHNRLSSLHTKYELNSIKDKLIDELKFEIDQTADILTLARFLYQMNDLDKAEEFYTLLLNELPSDHSDVITIKNNLGGI
ncbi:unnamed protein product [Rotaria sp. Silwood1]|nr:unnamed protein product [Rotaria sp. Silwood1]